MRPLFCAVSAAVGGGWKFGTLVLYASPLQRIAVHFQATSEVLVDKQPSHGGSYSIISPLPLFLAQGRFVLLCRLRT